MKSRFSGKPQAKKPARKLRNTRLRSNQNLTFSNLEPRHLLATVTVSTAQDVTNGNVTSIAALIANDGGDGISLREAITAANRNPDFDEINFSANLVDQTLILTQGQLFINSSLSIDGDVIGNDDQADIAVSGNDASRVFQIFGSGTDVTLDGLVITGGYATGSVSARQGGGVRVDALASATILNSRIDGNSAFAGGGGIYNNGTLEIRQTTIENNQGNNTPSLGGGLHNRGTAALYDVTLTQNEAGVGAGIGNSGTLTLTNTTLAGNTAGFVGGGLNNSGAATLNHTTISDNSAGTAFNGAGGGLTNTSTLTLRGSIVLGNTAMEGSEIDGTYTNGGGNVVSGLAAAVFETVNGNGGGVLADNGGQVSTIALLANVNNPALDALPPVSGLPFDATGQQRSVDLGGIDNGGASDAGAVELNSGETLSLIVTTIEDVENPFDEQTSLREAIALANSDPDHSEISFAADIAGSVLTLTQGQLNLSTNLTIDGGAGVQSSYNTTVDANNSSRIFNISGAGTTAAINGLDLVGGQVTGNGGAIYAAPDTATTVSNSNLYNNAAESTLDAQGYIIGTPSNGGAISALGSLKLVNSFIGYNFSFYGGSIRSASELTVVNSTFVAGFGSYGGAIHSGGTASVLNSTFTNNDAVEGGGIFVAGGTLTLSNSVVVGNYSNNGAETFGTYVNRGGNVIGGPVNDVFRDLDVEGNAQLLSENKILSLALLKGGRADGAGDVSLLPTEAGISLDVNQDGTIDSNPITVDAIGNSRTLFGTLDAGAREATELDSLVVTIADDLSIPDDNETSLREALAFANSNSDESNITFDPSLSGQTLVLTQGGLDLSSTLSIEGDVDQNGTADITLSGNNRFGLNVFDGFGDGANVSLDSLAITEGNQMYGGAVYVGPYSTARITNSDLSGNSAYYDGGAIHNAGALTIDGSRLSNNSGDYGGAIYSSGTLTILSSTIDSNSSVDGGGISIGGTGVLNLANSTVANNIGYYGGGILGNSGTSINLVNSTLSGNVADYGGGIFLNSGSILTLNNSIVLGNAANIESAEIGGSYTANGSIASGDVASVFAELDEFGAGVLGDNGGIVPTIALNASATNPALDNGGALDESVLNIDLNGDGDFVDIVGTDARGSDREVDLSGIDNGGTVDAGAFELSAQVTLAPQVVSATIDDGPMQSRPDLWSTLTVVFDANVSVSAGDLSLFNDSIDGNQVDLTGIGFEYNAITFTAIWNFDPIDPLPAAFYTYRLNSSSISAGGLALDGDATGSAGGDFVDQHYVAILGDVNLDGKVDVLGDGFILVGNLGVSGTGSWSLGDFNADGNVDVLNDGFALVGRLGQSVVPPTTSPSLLIAAKNNVELEAIVEIQNRDIVFASGDFLVSKEDKQKKRSLFGSNIQANQSSKSLVDLELS